MKETFVGEWDEGLVHALEIDDLALCDWDVGVESVHCDGEDEAEEECDEEARVIEEAAEASESWNPGKQL